ncbi:MAG: ureidoglycolate lyase [Pseudomonadota bacterium]
MSTAARHLTPRKATADVFAPFGELIQPAEVSATLVNGQRFERFDGLATIDCGDAPVNVGVMRCATATEFPCTIDWVERHPLGSQAFLPLDAKPYVVAVAPHDCNPDTDTFHAFVIPPRTGINMHPGVWHVPLLGNSVGQMFVVIDRAGDDNCDEHQLKSPLFIQDLL